MTTKTFLASALAFLCISQIVNRADDWPQWRGPHRDGISQETGLLKEWPKEGPKQLWAAKNLGSGYSAPSVVGNTLYLLGNEGLVLYTHIFFGALAAGAYRGLLRRTAVPSATT